MDLSRRDPLDPDPADKLPAILCKIGHRTAYLTGDPAAIIRACQATGAPYMRTIADRDIIAVPTTHVDDVLSRLEYGRPRRIVHITNGDTP